MQTIMSRICVGQEGATLGRAGRAHPGLPIALAIIAALCRLASAAPENACAGAPPAICGSWGLPAQGTIAASFLGLYASPDHIAAEIDLQAIDFSCAQRNSVWNAKAQRFDSAVAIDWNPQAQRFEWNTPASDTRGTQQCWLAASPAEQQLRVTFHCPYDCNGDHTQVLERLAPDRLVPPPRGNALSFCATHDALQLSLCRPGPLQDAIERAASASQKIAGLTDDPDADRGKTNWGNDNRKALFAALASCRNAVDGAACLAQRIEPAGDTLQARARALEQALVNQRAASAAQQVRLEDPASWQGRWLLSNEKFVSSLDIAKCAADGCVASIDAVTNYTFGYSERRGSCIIDDVPIAFTENKNAFGYAGEIEDDHYPQDNAPFVQYCRIDLERKAEGVRLALHGPGCAWRCMNAAQDYGMLQGQYRSLQRPSFDCAKKDLEQYRWDEQLVCLDAGLAALDRQLQALYTQALALYPATKRQALVQKQQGWIAARGACEEKPERDNCLRQAYAVRMQQLEPVGHTPSGAIDDWRSSNTVFGPASLRRLF